MRRNWRKIQHSLLRNSAPPAALTPDFGSLQIKGLTIALPGPQDTIDPDFAGIRSGLAALGIGYIGYSSNNFFDNMLPAERTTFGQQVYNGQKPTFFANNVMQMTYDLSRYGISDGQIVVGGIYKFDTWSPAVRTLQASRHSAIIRPS
jgi:porin